MRVAAYTRVPTTKKGAKTIPLAYQKGKIQEALSVIAKELGYPGYEVTWFGDQRERGDTAAQRHEEHLRLYYHLHDKSSDVVILFHESCGSTSAPGWRVLWKAMKETDTKLYILTRQLDLHSSRDHMLSVLDQGNVPEIEPS